MDSIYADAVKEENLAEVSAGSGEDVGRVIKHDDPQLPLGMVVEYALSRLGSPYVFGAAGPDTFDNSGFVVWCYQNIGVYLPHYTESILSSAKKRVPASEARPGDVLYRSGHVAISVGGTAGIEAPQPGTVVSYSSGSWTCALKF